MEASRSRGRDPLCWTVWLQRSLEDGSDGGQQEQRKRSVVLDSLVAEVVGAAPAVGEAVLGVVADVGRGDQEAASEEVHVWPSLVLRDILPVVVEVKCLPQDLDTARGHPAL